MTDMLFNPITRSLVAFAEDAWSQPLMAQNAIDPEKTSRLSRAGMVYQMIYSPQVLFQLSYAQSHLEYLRDNSE